MVLTVLWIGRVEQTDIMDSGILFLEQSYAYLDVSGAALGNPVCVRCAALWPDSSGFRKEQDYDGQSGCEYVCIRSAGSAGGTWDTWHYAVYIQCFSGRKQHSMLRRLDRTLWNHLFVYRDYGIFYAEENGKKKLRNNKKIKIYNDKKCVIILKEL